VGDTFVDRWLVVFMGNLLADFGLIKGRTMIQLLTAGKSESGRVDKNHSRHSWADFCRIFATFGVIMIHACGPSFYQYGKIPEVDWHWANLLDSVFRCSVPLFIMLSGAMLLGPEKKDISLRELARRIQRVLLPLISWSVLYLFFVSYHSGMPVKWLDPIFQPSMYHLWFVYMIIGIYLLLPVFISVFQLIRNRFDLQIYLLVFWIITNGVPVYTPTPLLSLLQQSNFLGYGGYFLMGGVLVLYKENRVPPLIWAMLFMAGVLVTYLLTKIFTEAAGAPIETPYLYLSPNVLVASIAAFMLLSRVEIPSRFQRFMAWVSDKTFLIYFMHVVVLERVANYVAINLFENPKPLFLLFVSLLTFLLCLVFSAAMRLLPFSRSILG
jgi:surface polysaccharide O-acyltransferase-like enzyme